MWAPPKHVVALLQLPLPVPAAEQQQQQLEAIPPLVQRLLQRHGVAAEAPATASDGAEAPKLEEVRTVVLVPGGAL